MTPCAAHPDGLNAFVPPKAIGGSEVPDFLHLQTDTICFMPASGYSSRPWGR